VLPLLLAAALASAHATALGPAPVLAEEEWDQRHWEDDDGERPRRIRLTAWGGEALDTGGSGRGSVVVGGEAAWAFSTLDLGVSGSGYRNVRDATREWAPVVLARITQRFPTRRGLEATFGFGIGAGRARGWKAWYQLALGMRVPLGPLFLAGELAFEQYDLLRLSAGLGVAFF
jgi:hypothetical protein